jgi:hypothetical protein
MAVVAARTSGSVPTTSGNSILNLSRFLSEGHGEGAFAAVLAEMASEDATALSGIILPQIQYPTASYIAAVDTACRLFDPDRMPERFGEWAAHSTMNSLFRFLLKFTSPAWAVSRGTRIWRTFHSTGEWETEIGERSFRGTLRDFAVVNGNYCRVVAGWIRGAGRLTGADIFNVSHPRCRSSGSPVCVFTAEW